DTRAAQALVELMDKVANTQVKAIATLGGSLVTRAHWVDMPVMLAGLGASASIVDLVSGESRTVSVESLSTVPSMGPGPLAASEIIVSVAIPLTKNGVFFYRQ
ncbi:hypothetical protein KIPB_016721, partial [Kipferlia bialata]